MRIHLLGTAAGGGVPQWNCSCTVCYEARTGSGRVQPRSQSSVAISADGQSWFLLNASPDIRAQIENFPPLQPARNTIRNSPIEGILLTNADIDHTLGLLLLREGRKLRVHATPQVRLALSDGFSLAPVLDSFSGADWIQPPDSPQPLLRSDGSASGLAYEAIPLSGKPPRFMKERKTSSNGYAVGYRITDQKSGGRLLFLPEVATLDRALLGLLPECEALLFDGTFWSHDEMRERGAGTLTATDMGHIPISGAAGSLQALARLAVKHKIYTHVNNTNPILIEDSPENAALRAAGCIAGRDDMELAI